MAQPTLSACPPAIRPTPPLYIGQLRRRLEENVATRHPWKQLLGTASKDTVNAVLRALEAYVQIWDVSARDGRQGCQLHDEAGVVDLLNAAEQDLEKGLSFIREVEKGSHMKGDAVLRFRPEAIEALCALCCGRIEELGSEASRESDEGREEGAEDRSAGDDEADVGREGSTTIVAKGRLTQDMEAARGLIGTVYRHAEPQFKSRLQVLVHKHKTKARSK